MANLFSNGFESGDLTAWEFNQATGAVTVAASTSAPKNGAYGVRAVTNNNASDTSDRGLVAEIFGVPANNIVYLEFWFRFASFSSAGYGSATSKAIACIQTDTTGQANAASGRPAFYLSVHPGPVLAGHYERRQDTTKVAVGTFSASAATWYRIRMMVDKSGAQPVLEWWTSTDGISFTSRGSATDASTDGLGALHYNLDGAKLGIVHVGQFEKGVYTVDIDDVTIDDAPYVAASTKAPRPIRRPTRIWTQPAHW